LLPVLLNTVGGDMQERSLSLLLRGRKLVSIAKEPPKKRAADHGVTASTSQSSRTAINSSRSQSSLRTASCGRWWMRSSPSPTRMEGPEGRGWPPATTRL